MQLQGKFEKVYESKNGETKNGDSWRRVGYVIKAPTLIALNAWNDGCDKVLSLKQGDSITVDFEIKSREYQDRWYTSLNTINIISEKVETDDVPSNEINDLPF